MDNTVLPYKDQIDSSDESDSSDSSEEGNLLTNNIGVLYNGSDIKDERFMNREKVEDYQIIRNKYFTPEIRKIRLMIESKNITQSSGRDTSNYKINFENNTSNSTSGYGNFDNVIGFRLMRANIVNSLYTLNENNRNVSINSVSITLTPGTYTFKELGDHLQDRINTPPNGLTGFVVDSNTLTYKYNISSGSSFTIEWASVEGYSHRLFGFNNENKSTASSHDSDNVVQQSNQFVDLVIPEIPYIACKRNSIGKHLIDRIPLDCPQGAIMHYSNDHNPVNYFTPINLNSLTIQLYEDTTDKKYRCQNNDNSFEFELTILNRNV